MSLSEQISFIFQDKEEFTLAEVYEAIPEKPKTTIRGRIYDNLGIKFEKLRKGVYSAKKGDNTCVLIEGDGRDLSFLEDESIDGIITDHAWDDKKSNVGGSRKFANEYECFTYNKNDFLEKARVLKQGCFLVEILPAENENNYNYLYKIKAMAKEAGLLYYSKVSWKKGNFVSNTGRKSKNTEDVMIFTKGKARNLRLDAKKTKNTGVESFMSGANKMLPTMFDVNPPSKKDRIHQAEKPLLLIQQIIEHISKEGELLLDQFAGSGVVGEASLSKNRNCILIEKLKENVEKIIKRLGCDKLEIN